MIFYLETEVSHHLSAMLGYLGNCCGLYGPLVLLDCLPCLPRIEVEIISIGTATVGSRPIPVVMGLQEVEFARRRYVSRTHSLVRSPS